VSAFRRTGKREQGREPMRMLTIATLTITTAAVAAAQGEG
jgi:hypothetical protein